MKRGGPLRRGKPLARGTGLARGTLKRTRTPIKAMSDKRAGELTQRADVRRVVLERDRECVMFFLGFSDCWGPPEVHEPEFRSRFPGEKPWLDPDRAIRLCRGHNRWVQEHDAWATSLGLSVHQGDPRWSAAAWRAKYLK